MTDISEPRPPVAEIDGETLTAAVHRLLDKGLPTTEAAAGALLNLRSVYARAVIPAEPRSRLTALNELLPRLMATLRDSAYREAVQILFGLAPGTRETSLTARRRQAADILNYHPDHFRTDIEPKLVRSVTDVVQDDLLRYRSRVKRASESLEPTGDTPSFGPEHLTHEEELVSRIWQHVYGLRAEMIAMLRLDRAEGFEQQAEDHRQATQREEEALQVVLQEYAETYGEQLIRHGEAEFSREALERLAGWRL